MNINQLLDLAKSRLTPPSDYELARQLGIQPSALSNYRHQRSVPDTYTATRLAQIAGVDPLEAIALAEMARAKTNERRAYWKTFLTKTASVLLGIVLILQGVQPAVAASSITDKLYIMRKWLKRLLALKPRQRHPLTITWT